MAESVYKVIELVGTSSESWEKAAAVAVERAAMSLRICASPRSFSRI
jgi:flavin-binding protein dodecin